MRTTRHTREPLADSEYAAAALRFADEVRSYASGGFGLDLADGDNPDCEADLRDEGPTAIADLTMPPKGRIAVSCGDEPTVTICYRRDDGTEATIRADGYGIEVATPRCMVGIDLYEQRDTPRAGFLMRAFELLLDLRQDQTHLSPPPGADVRTGCARIVTEACIEATAAIMRQMIDERTRRAADDDVQRIDAASAACRAIVREVRPDIYFELAVDEAEAAVILLVVSCHTKADRIRVPIPLPATVAGLLPGRPVGRANVNLFQTFTDASEQEKQTQLHLRITHGAEMPESDEEEIEPLDHLAMIRRFEDGGADVAAAIETALDAAGWRPAHQTAA